ncbi:MAG TPA: zinc-ribbon domain-containing protein [Candidatus Limnocylindria bacterium]|nr:zinc-ribbon domain-containing protein [Candidatus Limnocylindria bacterium]
MMNDERDRRDEATEQPTEPPSEAAAAEEFETAPTAASEPERTEPPADEAAEAPAPSDWPSTDAPREAWPTEPPAAGSGDADTWPTRAPERGDEPAWESAPAAMPDAAEPQADLGERSWDDAATDDATAPGEAPAEAPRDADTWDAHPPSEAEAYAAPPPERAGDIDDTAAMAAAAAATPAHSVPAASEMGESTQCPRCGTENRPGLAFCRNCGQRLVAAGVAPTVQRPGTPEGTMACPRCGTHNRAGVAFCQNCGANLRAVATPGYVPPAAAAVEGERPTVVVEDAGRAVLGPVVLLIGAAGMIAGWLLPFPYGGGDSLFARAFGSGGYGVGFWNAYPDVAGGLADQAYFGFAAPAPLLVALLVLLAIGGMVRARPGGLQSIGLGIALLWSIGLAVLFVVVEVVGNMGGPITELLRGLTPGGIIFFLASLIVVIGALTRFARS